MAPRPRVDADEARGAQVRAAAGRHLDGGDKRPCGVGGGGERGYGGGNRWRRDQFYKSNPEAKVQSKLNPSEIFSRI